MEAAALLKHLWPCLTNLSYSGMVRGYFFTAPIDFCITGIRVPTDASTGCQSVAILRFTDGGPTAYPTLTNAFNQSLNSSAY